MVKDIIIYKWQEEKGWIAGLESRTKIGFTEIIKCSNIRFPLYSR